MWEFEFGRSRNIPKDLRDTILYESSFKKCLWENLDFTNVSGNGCKFITCDFCGNKIINAAFQYSTFDNIFFCCVEFYAYYWKSQKMRF